MLTVRPKDKTCPLHQKEFGGCPAYSHFAVVVHRDNQAAFLAEHGLELDEEQAAPRTDFIAVFSTAEPDARLGFVLLSPPDSEGARRIDVDPDALDPRTFPTLIVNLYC